ncbi:Uncharacterised protein [uncultured archaeon]|nr:Uncharacterised protein [uncultured archaeon]
MKFRPNQKSLPCPPRPRPSLSWRARLCIQSQPFSAPARSRLPPQAMHSFSLLSSLLYSLLSRQAPFSSCMRPEPARPSMWGLPHLRAHSARRAPYWPLWRSAPRAPPAALPQPHPPAAPAAQRCSPLPSARLCPEACISQSCNLPCSPERLFCLSAAALWAATGLRPTPTNSGRFFCILPPLAH